jgi:glycerol uptake facilitator protein
LTENSLFRRCVAEFIGTLLLVYFGAGAAAITILIANGESPKSNFLSSGIGALGGLADWLAIGMAFAIASPEQSTFLGTYLGATLTRP